MQPLVRIEISDVLNEPGRSAAVRIRRTGKVAHLPVRHVVWLPGAVAVPEWLAKRILQENESAKMHP